MPGGEFLDGEGRAGPENIHGSMDPLAIQQRDGNRREAVIEWRLSIMTSAKNGIARGIASLTHLREDLFEPFWLARQAVIRFLRSA